MALKYDRLPVALSRKSRAVTATALSAIHLAPGMTACEVVGAVSAAIAKPIFLESTVDARFKTTTGSFAMTPEFVVIVFRGIDPHAYQMHSLFHELGHLLCGHQLCERPTSPLETSTVDHLLWNDAEREAEFLAYKITSLISRKTRNSEAFG